MLYRYRAEILEELSRHGVKPSEKTSPEVARQVIADLYLYEIRRLRNRLKRGEFPKAEYARRVDELRRNYPILSIPVRTWLLAGD